MDGLQRLSTGLQPPHVSSPPAELHCDELAASSEKGGRLLQRARDGGAVDQRGEARGQVDAALVHDLPGECRPPPAPRAGVQPRQLPPHAGAPEGNRGLVPDEPAREGGEDRAKVVAHGRYLVFQMAEVAVPRELFGRILDRIARLRPPDPAPCCRSKGATEAAGGRATPGIPPCGAAVRSEGPRKRPGPPWRGHHRALPCRRGENHCRRGHEGGIQAQGRGWAPSIWEIRSRKRP